MIEMIEMIEICSFTDITPTLEKLRTQRSAYLQWASNSTEIERLHRQQTAFAYYEAREILRQGDRENRLIAEELKLHDLSEKLLVCWYPFLKLLLHSLLFSIFYNNHSI